VSYVTTRAPHEASADPHDHLRAFVAGRDVPCPSCNYNLRDLTDSRCPECGQRLELRVGLSEPRLGLWIAGVVGLAAGAGFNLLLLVYVGLEVLQPPKRMGGILGTFVMVNGAGLLIMGASLACWLYFRRPFRRLGAPHRVLLVLGCWLMALTDVGIFQATIR
jgi:hypothetical protein